MDKTEAVPPGRRTFQRLNRAEYAQSVRDLLALDVDAGDYLPLDPKSANFDNIADAQLLSPTLMQSYLTAAAEISRLAVGDRRATAREVTFDVPRWISQREQVEGAPFGTRGGLSVAHTFPADGDYRFRVSFYHETTGALYGNGRAALHTAETPEQIEISVDGVRVALLDIDRWMNSSDPDGVNLAHRADPHHRRTAPRVRGLHPAVRRARTGPDRRRSTGRSPAPASPTPTASRRCRTCGTWPSRGRSTSAACPRRRAAARSSRATRPRSRSRHSCAHDIVTRLASQAFRRPVDGARCRGADGPLPEGLRGGRVRGRVSGWRSRASSRVRVSSSGSRNGRRRRAPARRTRWAISTSPRACRSSCGPAAPDASRCAKLAASGRLSAPGVLEQQVKRMLADPRAEVLGVALRRAVAAAAGPRQAEPRRPLLSRLRRAIEDGRCAARPSCSSRNLVREDRPVLDLVHRRLHVRRTNGWPGTTDPGCRSAPVRRR